MFFILQTLSIWVVRWQDVREKHLITSGNVMLQFLPSKALNIHKTLSWQPNKICRVCRLHIYRFSLISLWVATSLHLCIFNISHLCVLMFSLSIRICLNVFSKWRVYVFSSTSCMCFLGSYISIFLYHTKRL